VINVKRKGQVFVWFAIFIILFVFVMLYNMFTYPYIQAHDMAYDLINETDSDQKTRALNTISTINNVWFSWLLLLIFFLAIWGIVAAQRKEPYYQ